MDSCLNMEYKNDKTFTDENASIDSQYHQKQQFLKNLTDDNFPSNKKGRQTKRRSQGSQSDSENESLYKEQSQYSDTGDDVDARGKELIQDSSKSRKRTQKM